MVKSDHFKSEPARVSCDPLGGVLQCVSGAQGAFDLTAEARYVHKPTFSSFQLNARRWSEVFEHSHRFWITWLSRGQLKHSISSTSERLVCQLSC